MNTTTDAYASNDIRAPHKGSFLNSTLSLLIISLFPLALTSFIWIEVWNGVASRAIDGSGHYAVGQIYDASIFPDTFGWTNAYFAGMSFPNFYPPLFHWLVALIHHTDLVSFATSFKLVMAVPLLLIPAAFWLFVRIHADQGSATAFSVAIASMILLTLGEVFQPNTGLDMSSTILDGFYTQPLGFVLLLLWLLVYLAPTQRWWQFTLSAILLALTVLANFFNAITAVVFIATVLLFDVFELIRSSDRESRGIVRLRFATHLISPVFALLLTAFWIVPMATSYQYVVTRPIVASLLVLARPTLWVWYVLAAIGLISWAKKPKVVLRPYLFTCAVLFFLLVFSSSVAPPWFPLQVFRFFSTINLLMALPVGITIARLAKWYVALRPGASGKNRVNEIGNGPARTPAVVAKSVMLVVIVSVGLGVLAWVMSTKKLARAYAFYTPDNFERISGVLGFGKTHLAGRYLVEVLPSVTNGPLVRADSLALNAYLGSQGNQTVSIVYREASPNSPFFNAELNAFSAYTENFGISSMLMDDLDFLGQPLPKHLERLSFLGVKYLVIATPEMKDRLIKQPEISAHYEFGGWTVFEIKEQAVASVRSLQYKPALVVAGFTEKLRRQNQLDFARLTEEQFSDGWFDVLLARSPELKIESLPDLDNFGALILINYDCDNEPIAAERLKRFAQNKPLILIASNQSLFERIQTSIADYPNAVLLQHPITDSAEWIDALEPKHHYNSSSIRQLWREIRQVLESRKIEAGTVQVAGALDRNTIDVKLNKSASPTPVLISTTFHPKWSRSDRQGLYATTPFFTLGFFDKDTRLTFSRSWYDRCALWCSGITLLSLFAIALVSLVRRG